MAHCCSMACGGGLPRWWSRRRARRSRNGVAASGGYRRQGVGARQVHDVRAPARPPDRADDVADGDVLDRARPAGQMLGVDPSGDCPATSALSACTSSGAPSGRSAPSASSSSALVTGGKSSAPESARKHLKPRTPASCSGARSRSLPGTTPPQNPTSTWHCPAATWRLSSSAATVVVLGTLSSGMSRACCAVSSSRLAHLFAARVAIALPGGVGTPSTTSSTRCGSCSPPPPPFSAPMASVAPAEG